MLSFLSTPKQKLKLGILFVVLVIFVWQVYELFFSGSSISTPPAKLPNKVTVQKNIPTPAPVTVTPAAPTVSLNPPAATSVPDIDPTQKEYLQLLQEYKILELQKSIAADKQAIVASELQMMEGINKLNSMGGQALATNVLDLNAEGSDSSSGGNEKNKVFNLQYTGLEEGKWIATLKYGDNVYDVREDTIIGGKYKVTKINNNEVILNSPDQLITLTFDGAEITSKVLAPATPQPSSSVALPAVASTKPVNQPPVVAAPVVAAPAVVVASASDKKEAAAKTLATQEAILMHHVQTSEVVKPIAKQVVIEKNLAPAAKTQGQFLLQTEAPPKPAQNNFGGNTPMLETSETIVPTPAPVVKPATSVEILASVGPAHHVITNKEPPHSSTNAVKTYWTKFKHWLSGDETNIAKEKNHNG